MSSPSRLKKCIKTWPQSYKKKERNTYQGLGGKGASGLHSSAAVEVTLLLAESFFYSVTTLSDSIQGGRFLKSNSLLLLLVRYLHFMQLMASKKEAWITGNCLRITTKWVKRVTSLERLKNWHVLSTCKDSNVIKFTK